MAKCEFCGKDVKFGIKVSHSLTQKIKQNMEAQRTAC